MWYVFGHFCAFLARIVFAVAVAVLVYVVMTAGKNVFKVKQRIKEHKIIIIHESFVQVYRQLLLMWSIAIGNRW